MSRLQFGKKKHFSGNTDLNESRALGFLSAERKGKVIPCTFHSTWLFHVDGPKTEKAAREPTAERVRCEEWRLTLLSVSDF